MRGQPRARERPIEAGEGLIERFFSRRSPYLPLILALQLVFLTGLVVLAFVSPLSGLERWIVVVAAGALAGLTWAVLDHVRQR